MKEIMAIVRPSKVGATKTALAEAGFPSFTCQVVLGRGKKLMDRTLASAILEEGEVPADHVGEALSEPLRLISKRLFTLIVEEADVAPVVKLITDANTTRSPGDGKIFVLPITESYRVRNGEQAADAY
ncbi:P-II family nitrogen regulator [Gordonibacter sp. 28C]|uniref:P-II family nitrogen regulator n=1 Tax=Gordonibacter sp. 28C TaxID=2078569 RepID=UPI000DF7D2E4|nr:P-II family nitrogen regulator [Gordonibacter sp. 28C]RDB61830.1 P-II family nitrogen regulator [Gordonibacter sp. 28C]